MGQQERRYCLAPSERSSPEPPMVAEAYPWHDVTRRTPAPDMPLLRLEKK
jgi:hypothetical protein